MASVCFSSHFSTNKKRVRWIHTYNPRLFARRFTKQCSGQMNQKRRFAKPKADSDAMEFFPALDPNDGTTKIRGRWLSGSLGSFSQFFLKRFVDFKAVDIRAAGTAEQDVSGATVDCSPGGWDSSITQLRQHGFQ